MPFPPPMPNELTTSALPSPVVSRSNRTPPRAPDTATNRSPFSRATICRDGPIDSATIRAQKPWGSVSPALSGAQTGFLICGVGRSSNATLAKRSVRVMSEEYNFPAHANARGFVVPSLNTLLLVLQAATSPAQPPQVAALKQEVVRDVASRAQFTQQMVDQIFSYGELRFQETETSRYLVDLLRKNGFTVREGIFGIPTAWYATLVSGKPVISLGSYIDDISQASQKQV